MGCPSRGCDDYYFPPALKRVVDVVTLIYVLDTIELPIVRFDTPHWWIRGILNLYHKGTFKGVIKSPLLTSLRQSPKVAATFRPILPAPWQSASIYKPLDKLYPLKNFALDCIFSVSNANFFCRQLLLSNYYINAFLARSPHNYLIF